MKDADFRALGASDPRLAAHANGVLPAWLWSADGTRILWANPAGLDVFGLRDDAQLSEKIFGPVDPQRRQIAQLTNRLNPDGAVRMERLRGFGAAPGMLATCSCARIDLPDGRHGVLIVSAVRVAQRKMAQEPAVIMPTEVASEAVSQPTAPEAPAPFADYETPAQSNEAPAEFTLFDAFAEDDAATAAESDTMSRPDDPDLLDVLQLEPPHVEPAHEAATSAVEPPEPELAPPTDNAEEDLPMSERRHPLRFKWQTDRDARFSISSDEFLKLIGPLTESLVGRPWREIASALGLDRDETMQRALSSRETFSGVSLNWPVDGGYLPVELSGVPTLDDSSHFAGYQGFGVCRDIAGLSRLELLRRHGISISPPNPQPPLSDNLDGAGKSARAAEMTQALVHENSPATDLDHAVETPQETSADILEPLRQPSPDALAETPGNVLPFRTAGETKPLVLTPVENSAFNELARQLSARLENGDDGEASAPAEPAAIVTEPEVTAAPPPVSPDWLAPPEPPARGQGRRDKALLDLLPAGVLIYRLDRLLYANPAFLKRVGYASLHALEEAGGLDALFVEPGVSTSSSTSEAGTPVTISTNHVAAGRRGDHHRGTPAHHHLG